MENNPQIYITVLKNISVNSPVEQEAKLIIMDFEKNIKTKGINSNDFWQAQAYKDFYDLLSDKIRMLQMMQINCVNSIMFQVKLKNEKYSITTRY